MAGCVTVPLEVQEGEGANPEDPMGEWEKTGRVA